MTYSNKLLPALLLSRGIRSVLILIAGLFLSTGSGLSPQARGQSVVFHSPLYTEFDPGMRAMALGNNSVALSDGSYTIPYNASMMSYASPVRLDHSFFVIPGFERRGHFVRSTSGSMFQYLGGIVRLDEKITLGVGAHRLARTDKYIISGSDVRQREAIQTAALAWKIRPYLSVGMNLERVTHHIEYRVPQVGDPDEMASAFGFGGSATYRKRQSLEQNLDYRFTAATGIRNLISSKMDFPRREELPTILRIGVQNELIYHGDTKGKKSSNTYRLSLFTSYENLTKSDEDTRFTAGLEVNFLNMIYIRNGFNAEKRIRYNRNEPDEIRYAKYWSYGGGLALPMQRVVQWEENVTVGVDLYRLINATTMLPHKPFGVSINVTYRP